MGNLRVSLICLSLLAACAPVQFGRPLPVDARVSNFFDHDVPKQFVDTNGRMLTFWGEDTSFLDGHEGYDFVVPEGTPVLAVADARVHHAGLGRVFYCPPLKREVQDNFVRLEMYHRGALIRVNFQHLSKIVVAEGQKVKKGQLLGYTGNTGCSDGPHLHLVVYAENDDAKLVPVDPYGFQAGPGRQDPWPAQGGAPSENLWAPGEAPPLYREQSDRPNPHGGGAWLTITRLRWQGVDDARNPNNEFVEITLDPSHAPQRVDLRGYVLTDNRGHDFRFPEGFTLTHDRPKVRVYSGPGTNTADTLYWGLASGIWRNRPASDCAVLRFPNGTRYTFRYGKGAECPPPPPASVARAGDPAVEPLGVPVHDLVSNRGAQRR